jgi:hypothetical protein
MMRSPTAFASAFALALGIAALPARADLMFNLDTGNSAISGFTGPYATVDVHLVDATHATVEFTSLTNSGNIYLMGDGGSVAVNVNASSWNVTVPFTSPAAASNAGTGFTPGPYSDGGSGNEDGFGSFNQTVNGFDGFTHSADDVTIELENAGGTWAAANNVLTANPDGYLAAAHIFVTSSPANAANGAIATGFATGSDAPPPFPNLLRFCCLAQVCWAQGSCPGGAGAANNQHRVFPDQSPGQAIGAFFFGDHNTAMVAPWGRTTEGQHRRREPVAIGGSAARDCVLRPGRTAKAPPATSRQRR